MCGISSYIGKKNYESFLYKSLENQRHRGPDNTSLLNLKINENFIGLGHNRLSILDLNERSNQPFHHENYRLIYNGEIYNFETIKKSLKDSGSHFRTNSDTEVILRAFEKYGEASFELFQGIYAFILLDLNSNSVFAVRDPLGVKPLYFSNQDNEFFFSSEIRGLNPFLKRKEICEDDLFEFLNNHFISEPNTGFKNIKKVSPGTYMKITLLDKKVEHVSFKYSARNKSFGDFLIKESIKSQEISDVKNVIYFSGGIDSSVIAASVEEDHLLHIEYSKNEINDADTVASKSIARKLNKNLQIIKFDKDIEMSDQEFIKSVDETVNGIEELICDYTYLASKQISQEARKLGYKVALSGMGGDEIFVGYPRYKISIFHKVRLFILPFFLFFNFIKLDKYIFKRKFERFMEFLREKNFLLAYSRLLGYLSSSEIRDFFEPGQYKKLQKKFESKLSVYEDNLKESYLSACLSIDRRGFLSRNLTVADKSSMSESIELRVPLLDLEIINVSKILRKNNLMDYFLPKFRLEEYLLNYLNKYEFKRRKVGFNPPLAGYINNIDRETYDSCISILESVLKGMDKKMTDKIYDDHTRKIKDNTYKIFQLIFLSRWINQIKSYNLE